MTIDTHIVNDDGVTIEELFCDDTETINDQLSLCESLADYHKQIADVMGKYQKIQEIMAKRPKDMIKANPTLRAISEVLEDGNE